jgi:predicted XRE-type DNA-binding protein
MVGRKHTITLRERFEEKYLVAPNGCWEWTATRNHSGYGQIRTRSKPRHAHRVSWEIYRGPIGDGLHVLHRCDNRRCVNPDHLFLGTHVENMRDMNSKGRGAIHERHGSAKLTEAVVAEIRSLKGAMLQREIAAQFGISKSQVGNILRGEQWNGIKLTDPEPDLAAYQSRYRNTQTGEAA